MEASNHRAVLPPTLSGEASRSEDLRRAPAPSLARRGRSNVNVHRLERVASAVAGAWLVAYVARAGSRHRAPAAVVGAGLLLRGVTGHCHTYGALGVSTAAPGAEQAAQAEELALVDIEQSITIGKPATELFILWSRPDIGARLFQHFADVSVREAGETVWRVHTPLEAVVYTTRIVERREGERLRWESSASAGLSLRGTVEFRPAPGDLGTEVTLRLAFQPPAGALGRGLVKLLGPAPKLLVQKALRRFKSWAETGEIPTLARNPAARHAGRDE